MERYLITVQARGPHGPMAKAHHLAFFWGGGAVLVNAHPATTLPTQWLPRKKVLSVKIIIIITSTASLLV